MFKKVTSRMRSFTLIISFFLFAGLFCTLNELKASSVGNNVAIENNKNSKLSRQDFLNLMDYAKEYLKQNENSIVIQRNISGFVRIKLPSPEYLSNDVKSIRLNYWLPGVSIDPDSIHDHPQYFESMIVKGGYTHELFKPGTDKDQSYAKYRIYKKENDERTAEFLGQSNLISIGKQDVQTGSIITFPKSMIHRILVAEPSTLSINVVFKNDSDELFFDAYYSDCFNDSDLITEREVVAFDEAKHHITEIADLLSENKVLTA